MTIKTEIIELLRANKKMTQSELAARIYGDKHHISNIHSSLMSLVQNKTIIRHEESPIKYSLNETCNVTSRESKTLSQTQTKTRQSTSHQEKLEMTAENAIILIQDFLHETKKDTHSRYMSWVHCYKVFSKERNKTDENTLDYLALNLAFYLASWGMYRGSSFLLQKDYKIHISIARIIQEEQYNPLHGISAIDLLKDSNLALLEDAGARIKFAYENEEPILNGKSINATSTLITKILLGTLGCVPAYDRFYTSSVRDYKISSSSYNRHSVCDIAKFYCEHFDKFERFRRTLNNHEIDYPPMKLMDMCFWQAGYMKDLENKKKK